MGQIELIESRYSARAYAAFRAHGVVPTMRIDYACMQASGMVMNHTQDCDRYADLANAG